MMTLAPTFEWRHLLALVRPPRLALDALAKPWATGDERAIWLSRSAWALRLVADWRRRSTGAAPVVWVPAYFCNQSLALLRAAGVELVFYPVRDDFECDWAACSALAAERSVDLFVIVHYFGRASDVSRARRLCKEKGAILVEDATHALRAGSGIGGSGDFVLYSPHKLLAVPDGAVLVVRTSGDGLTGRNAAEVVAELDLVLSGLGQEAPSPWPWLLRRLLQRLLPDGGATLTRRRLPEFDADPAVGGRPSGPRLSRIAHKLLACDVERLDRIAERRRENDLLHTYLYSLRANGFSLPMGKSSRPAPYAAIVRFDSHEHARAHYMRLLEAGVLAQTWPDLPPEAGVPATGDVARRLRQTQIVLPTHQSLRAADFAASDRAFADRCAKVDLSSYEMRWVDFDHAGWQRLLRQLGRSSMPQDDVYGTARCGGLMERRHIVFYRDGVMIAAAQALKSKHPGRFGLFRINRGPLWVAPEPAFEDVVGVIALIRKTFRATRGSILLIAPELRHSAENLLILARFGLRSRQKAAGWATSWIDLRKSEDFLRKGLASKWRNQLVSAEKAGVRIEIESHESAFQWLMERYDAFKSDRDFDAPSAEWVANYRRIALAAGCAPQLSIAYDQAGARIAGNMVCWHGNAATYFIGWNGPEGRKLNANNALLWQSALAAKRGGAEWFDLGGVDDVHTAPIARFKRGMNGDVWRLVGEFISV